MLLIPVFVQLMAFVLSMIMFLWAAQHDNGLVGCVTLNEHSNLPLLPRTCSELSD